ncbi:hypothetical protein OG204_16830 [Streptomyces sp. NBC_01387]|uniref:hypothetical protein n=1 Tax=unclassified Streptomyces TaxID=2593676 RepID=UPI0020253050|nr:MULTISPECIES: hypothetical protein [unclassified Streptomyces]MCX4549974.1 hypothetical protein [Streptomyces sp. NBC_01500]WSV55424.1 hypothetical protein OG282_17945 [Streptomyces sp. NBC_01014]
MPSDQDVHDSARRDAAHANEQIRALVDAGNLAGDEYEQLLAEWVAAHLHGDRPEAQGPQGPS